MNVHNFIIQNDIRPADAIIVKKMNGLLDHYVIYLGQDENGVHWFSVNMAGTGITLIPENDAIRFLLKYIPNRINRFMGNDYERDEAVNRAFNYPVEGYDLILNNCEHYSNFVQTGKRKSVQSGAALSIGSLVLLGLLAGLGGRK